MHGVFEFKRLVVTCIFSKSYGEGLVIIFEGEGRIGATKG